MVVCVSGLSCRVKKEKKLVWKCFLKPEGIHYLNKSKYLLLNHTEMPGQISAHFRDTFGEV